MRTASIVRTPFPLLASCVLVLASAARAQIVERVSLDPNGAQFSGDSLGAAVSADGRYAAFWNRGQSPWQVYVRDRATQTTTMMSVDASGVVAGNAESFGPVISANGRFVGFSSRATNIVPGATSGILRQAFVRDRWNGTTRCVSLDLNGQQANDDSGPAWISADGKFVGFWSAATNLVPGNTSSGVFVRDTVANTTDLVSLDTNGNAVSDAKGGWLSDDGRYVSFVSSNPSVVPGLTGSVKRLFVRDRTSGTTVCASVNAAGNPVAIDEGGMMSADGRYVAFNSAAPNVVGLPAPVGILQSYVRDLATGVNACVSVDSNGTFGSADSSYAALSASGRYAAFYSYASNLLPAGHDTNAARDVFVHDLLTGGTKCASVALPAANGITGNLASENVYISADGQCVGYYSWASNLVQADTNNAIDAFVTCWSCAPCQSPPVAYCTAKVNSLGCTPAISWSGNPSATCLQSFTITASNIVDNRFGILFYGTTGRHSFTGQCPWSSGGYLCVKPPLSRTLLQNSGGTPWSCDGTFSIDFNAVIQSGANQQLAPGASVNGEYWFRDPQAPCYTGTTDAIEFTICP